MAIINPIGMTSLVVLAIIRATVKRVRRHCQACSSDLHLESYRFENSGTTTVFQEIFYPTSDKKVREYTAIIILRL